MLDKQDRVIIVASILFIAYVSGIGVWCFIDTIRFFPDSAYFVNGLAALFFAVLGILTVRKLLQFIEGMLNSAMTQGELVGLKWGRQTIKEILDGRE